MFYARGRQKIKKNTTMQSGNSSRDVPDMIDARRAQPTSVMP